MVEFHTSNSISKLVAFWSTYCSLQGSIMFVIDTLTVLAQCCCE